MSSPSGTWIGLIAVLSLGASAACSSAPSGNTPAPVAGDSGSDDAGTPLVVNMMSENFGSVVVGAESDPVSLTVTNGGSSSTAALGVALTGANAGAFSMTSDSCSGHPLDPGASCTLSVMFKPLDVGTASASISIAGGASSSVVALAGQGTKMSANVAVTPSAYDFAITAVGDTSNAMSFVVLSTASAGSESGTLNAKISGSNAADFVITADKCSGTSLPNGQSCIVHLGFKPSAIGSKSASLVVSSATGASVSALSALGVDPPALVMTPTQYNFGALPPSMSLSHDFTVHNAGGLATGAITVSLGGSDASSFAILANGCTGALPAADSCTITVAMSGGSAGQKSATLDVTAMPGGAASAALNGTGL